MKGKSFLLLLLLACALVAVLVLVSRPASKSTAATGVGAVLTPVEQSGKIAAHTSAPTIPLADGTRPVPKAATAEEEPADPSEVALDEIQKQLDAGDPASLRMIAVQLRHDQPAVRRAAREALREAGARETVPDIQMAADATTDPREATELLDLIDYINLPTLKELEDSGELPSQVTPSTRPPRSRRSALRNPSAAPTTQPLPGAGQPTADQLALLRAENEQLKRENLEMKEILNRLLPPK